MTKDELDYIGFCIKQGAGITDADAQRVIKELHDDATQLRIALQLVIDKETESHTSWDRAFTAVAHGNLDHAMREGAYDQTYWATDLHAEAMGIARKMLK